MPKIKNILIFIIIAAVLVLAYIFFIKPSLSGQASLVSSTDTSTSPTDTTNPNIDPSITGDFLTLLLNIKTIKLDDGIFSDPAFNGLHDSSITLVPDSTQGRPNPFAQFGNENTTAITTTPAKTTTPATTKTTTTTKTTSTSGTTSTVTNGTTVKP